MNQPNLQNYWMPFTSNRYFKDHPVLFDRAEKHHIYTNNGDKVLDAFSGMWCVNAGHCHPKIVEATQKQLATMDYSAVFQAGSSPAFHLAEKVASMAPEGMDTVFFTNSGSEAVDTAMKIALAWHRTKGDAQRTRFIGRERGYHGVGFGGISVGGIGPNRKMFGNALAGVDHLPHTLNLEHNAFTRGLPEWGAHLADELNNILALHDPSTVAAVIVEPVAGSTGILPPPKGYLEKLREITSKHGILLIFDEVITGFGRLGSNFGAQRFGVTPDIITTAKGITNGTIPMGAVIMDSKIHDDFMHGPEHMIELFHGYTYSGHPVAAAAGLATLNVYEEEGIFAHAREMEQYFEDAVHSLADLEHVVDIRNIGLMGAVELKSRPGEPLKRSFEVYRKCIEEGVLVRQAGEIIALSPILTFDKPEYDQTIETLRRVIQSVD